MTLLESVNTVTIMMIIVFAALLGLYVCIRLFSFIVSLVLKSKPGEKL